MLRTHTCGQLRSSDIGQSVTICGWVHTNRDHGGLLFIDLRDYSGITQVVFNPEKNLELHNKAKELRSESVILISGKVENRPGGTLNKKIPTGDIEIVAESLVVLSTSLTPPFEIEDDVKVSEEIRLKFRYLDIRRPSMQRNLRLRHKLCKAIRDSLSSEGFIEVETPILTKSTPEGARDFLVPSRLNPGKFYALPQSPQLFKQMLMVAGLDRYFQIAKCFRDEDLRRDRQPEFTQLDVEMSFIDEEDIYIIMEKLIKEMFAAVPGFTLKTPFPRLKYADCMRRFGSDKPDMRFGMEFADLTGILADTEYKIFGNVIKGGGKIFAACAEGGAKLSAKDIELLIEFAKGNGAKGLSFFKVKSGGLSSPIDKFFKKETLDKITEVMKAKDGDLILAIADQEKAALPILGLVRDYLIKKLELKPKEKFSVLWIVDFPLFKYNAEEKRWEAEHHPFTSPKTEDIEFLESDPGRVRAKAYDVVINGTEIGSGSIRIHDSKLQERLFKVIGIDKKQAEDRFGFLLEAFKYGAPPHGGIALGIDRLLTIFTGCESIRDVIAFPKTQKGACLLSDAPSGVDEIQLKELNIKIR